MGVKQTAAVVEVAAEFKCTDRTIRKVLAWDRQRKSTEAKLTNIGVDIDRIDDLLSKLIGLARNGNPRALEFLVGFPPQLIEIAERLWDLADRANRKYGLRKPWRKPTVLVLPFLEKSLALNFTRI
jgi:hypothetical protein